MSDVSAQAEEPLPAVRKPLTRQWWLYLILLFLFFLPSYSTLPLDPARTNELVLEVLSNPIAYSVPTIFPLFKLFPLILILWLVIHPNHVISRLFYGWAGVNLLLVAIFQDMATTPTYGFAVLVGNVVVLGVTAILWIIASFKKIGSELSLKQRLPGWRYWVVPFALLAFWYPVNTAGGTPVPNFAATGIIANEAGLTFCMMLAVYLAVLTLAFPRVDLTDMRISGFVGFVVGLLNVVQFLTSPAYGLWMAVLHLPLVLISLFAFILSLRR